MYFLSFTLVPLLRVLCEYRPLPRKRILGVRQFLGGLARRLLRGVELALVLILYMDTFFA